MTLWDSEKLLNRKFMSLNVCIKIEETSLFNDISFIPKKHYTYVNETEGKRKIVITEIEA